MVCQDGGFLSWMEKLIWVTVSPWATVNQSWRYVFVHHWQVSPRNRKKEGTNYFKQYPEPLWATVQLFWEQIFHAYNW